MQLPNPGQWFQRRYELGELLGKGGFAAVYRAVDHDVGREVAIKILMPDHNGYEPGLVQRFMREGRIVAGLQDPHTITMFDFGRTEDDLLFMVFEYVPGSDLSKLLIRTGPMPELTVIHILEQLLSALREAHNAGILHRDIKPANVLVHTYMDDDRRVKLLDFGIAKPTLEQGEVDELEEGTKSGMSPGTPRYMSPEQIYGDDLTPASDIFSLGLVAHELLTGRPAIQGRTTKETLLQQLSDKPIKLPPFLRISPEVRQLVDRMTQKRPSDRFQSAQEVGQQLSMVRSVSLSRPLPTTNATLKRREATVDEGPRPPMLTPRMKEALSTIGLIAVGVLVGAAIVVPLITLLGRDAEEPAPLPPEPVVVQPAPPTPVAPTPPPAAAPDAGRADAEPKSGCGVKAEFVGQKELRFRLGATDRRYAAYIPKSYDANVPQPVVMLLHDERHGPDGMLTATKLGAVAEKHGFLVVAPFGGRGESPWNVKTDGTFLRAVLDDVQTRLCVDPTHVFVVGHGVSGKAAEDLACEMPLSGIAITSYVPVLGASECRPDPRVPEISLFGMNNRFFTASGHSACIPRVTISLERQEDRVFERNGCTGSNERWGRHRHGKCETRECSDAPFVTCHLDDGYELTSGAALYGGCIAKPTKFDVANTIWEFFDREGRALP